jgi:hypothetical protein
MDSEGRYVRWVLEKKNCLDGLEAYEGYIPSPPAAQSVAFPAVRVSEWTSRRPKVRDTVRAIMSDQPGPS